MRRLLIFDHLSSALHSLRANRTRSFLTTLGITIGIASVTTILTLAAGVANSVNHQIDDIGGNIAVVRPGVSSSTVPSIVRPISPQQYSTSTLDEQDITMINAVDPKLAVAPIMTVDGTLKARNGNVSNGMVVATTPSFIKTTPLAMQDGDFIADDSPAQSAIIGWKMAIDLFGTDSPLGQNFELRKQTFTVVGVLKKIKNPINFNNIDFDSSIIIPFESGKKFHSGRSQIQQINVVAPDSQTLQTAVPKIEAVLDANHGERDFAVISGNAIAEPTNTMFNVLARIMAAIAVVSLVVGGIGIMNIMLVSVAERTREIGIRKAVGASNINIVWQFLIESLIISLTGGLIGVIIGLAVAYLLGLFFLFTPIITLETILVAGGLSLIVGIIFGIYPALRAASKDPIESLRHYR